MSKSAPGKSAAFPYATVIHLLSLIETQARNARENLVESAEIISNPPRPRVALAGDPPDTTPQQAAHHAQIIGMEGQLRMAEIVELANRMHSLMVGARQPAAGAAPEQPTTEPPAPLKLAEPA